MKNVIALAMIGFSLLGCETTTGGGTPQGASSAWLSVVGRELVNDTQSILLNADGTVVGTGISGTWEEQRGLFCRTLTQPESLAGTECQVVTLVGDQITFDDQKGRVTTWTVL
ncbi:hypothetical protein [Roseivivax sp. CAU 1753]